MHNAPMTPLLWEREGPDAKRWEGEGVSAELWPRTDTVQRDGRAGPQNETPPN